MALTEFVRNVRDISDDGGYKFRFHCDRCSDGVESQYVASAANLLKTGLEVFSMFRLFGGRTRSAVNGIDRGLRGKERDSATMLATFTDVAGGTKWKLVATFEDATLRDWAVKQGFARPIEISNEELERYLATLL